MQVPRETNIVDQSGVPPSGMMCEACGEGPINLASAVFPVLVDREGDADPNPGRVTIRDHGSMGVHQCLPGRFLPPGLTKQNLPVVPNPCPACQHASADHRHIPPRAGEEVGAFDCTQGGCPCTWTYDRASRTLAYQPARPLP